MRPAVPSSRARERTRGENRGSHDPPLGASVAAWALLQNAVWEYAQCALLYDMRGVGLQKGALLMTLAVGGDVLVVLALYGTVTFWRGRRFPRRERPWRAASWGLLLVLSLAAALLLEYLALGAGLWRYSAHMRTLRVGGERLGWSPLLQVTLLPTLSVWLASRRPLFQRRTAGARD